MYCTQNIIVLAASDRNITSEKTVLRQRAFANIIYTIQIIQLRRVGPSAPFGVL